ncbi:MAG: CapA family protein, partial [Gammaproteobacteria bacterium]|nr:CapA family protein [Gammaproteobacteria bacterium]
FAEAGFDVLSLANNHARDFGEEGRTATMQALDALGITHSGRIGDIASWRHNDYTIAMIAFAPNPGSYDINNITEAVSEVATLAASHDIVLVSFHGGAEGVDALHVTFDTEFYYGEKRGNVVEFSRRVIDAGADLVIGHGPHVPRGLELYRDRLIAYSLGNFNTYQGISIQGIKGLAPILKLRMDETGAFLDGRIISTRQSRPGGPKIDPANEAALLIKRLSEEDFGKQAPRISANGVLSRPE